MTLFRKKYRVESARKRNWDYSLPGCYFVTICSMKNRPYFGWVVQEEMKLSFVGKYAAKCWQEIPTHHTNVSIDEFTVMPKHIHGIIVIAGPERLPKLRLRGEIQRMPTFVEIDSKAGSLGAVVGSFKSAVTRQCHVEGLTFGWHARFHDRIIRGSNSLKAVRVYIRDNPKNWHKDTLFVA